MRYERFLLEEWKQSGDFDKAEKLFGGKNLIKSLGEETVVRLISEALVENGKMKQMTIGEIKDVLRDRLSCDSDDINDNHLQFLVILASRMF